MTASDSTVDGAVPRGPAFPSTHWSVVLAAGEAHTTVAQQALEKLCRIYWYPLYGFVRRQGHNAEEAQDLTQEFFARLLKRELFKKADRERGRLRTFLLKCLRNFLTDEWRKDPPVETVPIFSIDATEAEQHYHAEPSHQLSPDKIFEKQWAAALLERVLQRLGDEYAAQDKRDLFERLKVMLWGNKSIGPYAELAPQLGLTEGALKVAVHRLRQRYLEVLRMEVADTLANPADVNDELRHLIHVMAE